MEPGEEGDFSTIKKIHLISCHCLLHWRLSEHRDIPKSSHHSAVSSPSFLSRGGVQLVPTTVNHPEETVWPFLAPHPHATPRTFPCWMKGQRSRFSLVALAASRGPQFHEVKGSVVGSSKAWLLPSPSPGLNVKARVDFLRQSRQHC